VNKRPVEEGFATEKTNGYWAGLRNLVQAIHCSAGDIPGHRRGLFSTESSLLCVAITTPKIAGVTYIERDALGCGEWHLIKRPLATNFMGKLLNQVDGPRLFFSQRCGKPFLNTKDP
jgi:hypothetical protein